MKSLAAILISPGLGRGKSWMMEDPLRRPLDKALLSETDIENEKRSLEAALAVVAEQIRATAKDVATQMTGELAEVFRAHEMMLESLLSNREFCVEIETGNASAEMVVQTVFARWETKFLRLKDPVFQSKVDDMADLFQRIMRELTGERETNLCERIPRGCILVTPRLLPSDVVGLTRQSVEAIVVEQLGKGSHAALLAREKGIPTLAGISVKSLGPIGTEVLVDSAQELVIVEPDEITRGAFEERLAKYKASLKYCQTRCRQPAVTTAGETISVFANIGSLETTEAAANGGADGVGLFRLEQLYLGQSQPPKSDQLLNDLRSILKPLQKKPVTIRLVDIGGDKVPPFLATAKGLNPLLGRRGVRLLLSNPDLLRAQLSALLRLSAEMPIKILVPMVTLASDMQEVRAVFEELIVQNSEISPPPPLGAMIETPAAALQISDLCAYSDFFSIGSNDLTQYALAADRENPEVDTYYDDTHPAVFSLIRSVIAAAEDKPVTLCGELASKEVAIPKLVKMGMRAFSVAPIQIPNVKELIRML